MENKIIEACDGTKFNWGKFMLCRFTEEWKQPSALPENESSLGLLRQIGFRRVGLWVMDLQTKEGAYFFPDPRASAPADLQKHRIWVCPMFEPFLIWLYSQPQVLLDWRELPAFVDLGSVPTSMQGYRRPGPGN